MSNRTVAEEYFRAVERGEVDAALACFTPGAEFVGPMGTLPFPEGVRAYLSGYTEPFPDARFEVTNAIEQDDQVMLEGWWGGTHKGPLSLPDGTSIPATNRAVRAPFVTVFRVSNGRIASHRGYWDMASFIGQLTGK
jgi:steroid delta-isomerase-like uncharacterized protein